MSFINNFISVVKLSSEDKTTICGYFIESYRRDGSDIIPSHSAITVGFLHYSRDGEVRKVTVLTHHVDNIIKDPIWDDIEDGILPFIKNMELSTLFYFPHGTPTKIKNDFKKRIQNNRYDIIIAIMHIFMLLEAQTLAQPPDTLSNDIIFKHFDELMTIKKMVDDKSHENAMTHLIYKYTRQVLVTKIIPLTIAESHNIENIRHRVWREYYTQQMCIYIINYNISEQFAKYALPWQMLHNIDKDMFQNPSILSKFKYSDVIDKFHHRLTVLQTLPSITNKIAISSPDTSRDDFDRLLQYSADNLILSKFAVTFYSLYLSRPVYLELSKVTIDTIHQLIFHWLYAFLVLHSFAGVIHTDAHVGNIHVRDTRTMKDIIIDNMVFHIMKPVTGVLLDFSRVIINPYHLVVRSYAKNVSYDLLAIEQGELLLRFYVKCFPSANNINIIIDMIKKDFDRAFHILSLLDPIFALSELRTIITDAKCLSIIDTLQIKCTELMNNYIANNLPISEYPLTKIIKENFGMLSSKVDETPYMLKYNLDIMQKIVETGFMRFNATVNDEENILANS